MARKSLRKPARARSAPGSSAPRPAAAQSDRERIIAAFPVLLADKPYEVIGFADIAEKAGVSLTLLRGEFSSTLAILAAHIKSIDRAVLAADLSDMAEEPERERLFDVLMRRLEALAPHRDAVRSQQWMLTAAGISASGPRGIIRAQGLAVLFASVLRVWVRDEDPGLARTMAALDRALARGQRFAGFLDDLCYIPSRFCRLRSRRRRRGDDAEEQASA